jgi:uncharacterized membrane protein YfcA
MFTLVAHLPIFIATFLLAGLVKGVTGLGLPTVAVGLLSLVMLPAQAASLVVMPSLVTNIWQMASGPVLDPLVRRLWPMLAAVCLGTWAGSGLLTGAGAGAASGALGAALTLYAITGLLPIRLPRVPTNAEWWLGPVAGAATGLVTAATGVFVIPAVPYLQALGLDRENLVQALGLSFTVSTIALAASLAGSGVFGAQIAGDSLLALIPALAGMFAGQWVRRKVSAQVFRRCFFVGLLMLGGHLTLRGLL